MEEIDLKEMFDYFKGKVVWILIALIVAVLVGNTYTFLRRVPMYKSNTTIVLVSEHQNEGYNTSELQLNKNLVSTYSEIIKSRKVLEPVINNLNLDYSYGTLKSHVSVSSVTNTEIIKVVVADKDPEVSTKIADEIANVFTEEIQKIYKINNVSIVDTAVADTKPYNVSFVKDNAIYMALALVLSCGIIFICLYFDTTIKKGEDIENKLGLTVIGTVPRVGKDKE
jgi:capsular polysaccharide biosynthesis protein